MRAWRAAGKNSPRPSLLPSRLMTGDGAGLDPAVADRAHPGGLGHVFPGQRLEPGVQRLLVASDPQDPVRAAGAQVGGQLPGGEPGVDGDHRAGQQAPGIQCGGQRHRGGDLATFAGLGRAGDLAESDPAGVVVAGDQMRAPTPAGRGGDLLGRGARRGSASCRPRRSLAGRRWPAPAAGRWRARRLPAARPAEFRPSRRPPRPALGRRCPAGSGAASTHTATPGDGAAGRGSPAPPGPAQRPIHRSPHTTSPRSGTHTHRSPASRSVHAAGLADAACRAPQPTPRPATTSSPRHPHRGR